MKFVTTDLVAVGAQGRVRNSDRVVFDQMTGADRDGATRVFVIHYELIFVQQYCHYMSSFNNSIFVTEFLPRGPIQLESG